MKLIQDNTFFICEEYYLFVFETEDGARDADLLGYFPIDATADCMLVDKDTDFWARELKEKVTCVNPGELIYLLDKFDKWWHVIADERIGWIIAEKGFPFKSFGSNGIMV